MSKLKEFLEKVSDFTSGVRVDINYDDSAGDGKAIVNIEKNNRVMSFTSSTRKEDASREDVSEPAE